MSELAARIATLPAHRPAGSASIEAVTQSDAAGLLNVSRPSVQRARSVLDHGAPALVALALLAAAQAELAAGTDPATVALAHAGAALVLFADFDPVTAERLAAAIENQATH